MTALPDLSPLLAASAQAQRAIFVYLAVIVAAAVAVVAVALVVRKLLLRSPQATEAFTLSDIRRLHAEGELSDEEFEATRKLMIAKHKATMLDDEGDKKNPPDEPDKDHGLGA